jgi:hypothetical protein
LHSFAAFFAAPPDMLIILLIALALLAAALDGRGDALRLAIRRSVGLRLGPAGKTQGVALSVLLGCVTDGPGSALAAAWARPAPAVAPPPDHWRRAHSGSPPGRPHGPGPAAGPSAPRTDRAASLR